MRAGVVNNAPEEVAWFKLAACQGMDPKIFYPTKRSTRIEQEVPRAICRGCPVRERCLIWAIEHHEDDGIWGGLSARARRAYARRAA